MNPREYVRQRLTDDDVFAAELLAIAFDRFGMELFPHTDEEGVEHPGLLPDTVVEELERIFSVQCPEIVLHKLGAAMSLKATNFFCKDKQKFWEICNILSGTLPNEEVLDLADASEVLWGLFEANEIEPLDPNDPNETFSSEIEAYVKFALESAGLDFDLTFLGEPEADALMGSGDPELEAAMGAARIEQTRAVLTDFEETKREFQERLKRLPLTTPNR